MSSLSLAFTKSKILKTGEGKLGVVEPGILTSSVAVSTRVGGKILCDYSGASEKISFSGEIEQDARYLGVLAGFLFCPATKTPRSQKRLVSSTFRKVRLHAR